jgi:hypothetical protein
MSNTNYIHQTSVTEFLVLATSICIYLEEMECPLKSEFIDRILCDLPVLYTKARQIPTKTALLDGEPERFVSEFEYNIIREKVEAIFGSDDTYLEVFVEDMRYSDEPITAFISENIADIYQELSDLARNWSIDDETVQHDALVACLEGFTLHWGQKLLNVLRPLHVLSLAKDENLYD